MTGEFRKGNFRAAGVAPRFVPAMLVSLLIGVSAAGPASAAPAATVVGDGNPSS